MIKIINGAAWFCCPTCGQKIHPVVPGARGVFVVCKARKRDGSRCGWTGEITYNSQEKLDNLVSL